MPDEFTQRLENEVDRVKDDMLALSDAAAKAGTSEEMFKKQTGLM